MEAIISVDSNGDDDGGACYLRECEEALLPLRYCIGGGGGVSDAKRVSFPSCRVRPRRMVLLDLNGR